MAGQSSSYVEETEETYGFSLPAKCFEIWYLFCNGVVCVLLKFVKTISGIGACLDRCDLLTENSFILHIFLNDDGLLKEYSATLHCVRMAQDWFEEESDNFHVLYSPSRWLGINTMWNAL